MHPGTWWSRTHVLEHVDDRKALAEIHRVLTPGGFAVLSFPIALAFEKTYENADVPPEQRRLNFGQGDHLRMPGRFCPYGESRGPSKINALVTRPLPKCPRFHSFPPSLAKALSWRSAGCSSAW
jgi:SAM-dependent methyltransferase